MEDAEIVKIVSKMIAFLIAGLGIGMTAISENDRPLRSSVAFRLFVTSLVSLGASMFTVVAYMMYQLEIVQRLYSFNNWSALEEGLILAALFFLVCSLSLFLVTLYSLMKS